MAGATRASARGVTDMIVGSGALLGLLSELEIGIEIECYGRGLRIDLFFSRMLGLLAASESPACFSVRQEFSEGTSATRVPFSQPTDRRSYARSNSKLHCALLDF